jgi:hypothetical protein
LFVGRADVILVLSHGPVDRIADDHHPRLGIRQGFIKVVPLVEIHSAEQVAPGGSDEDTRERILPMNSGGNEDAEPRRSGRTTPRRGEVVDLHLGALDQLASSQIRQRHRGKVGDHERFIGLSDLVHAGLDPIGDQGRVSG